MDPHAKLGNIHASRRTQLDPRVDRWEFGAMRRAFFIVALASGVSCGSRSSGEAPRPPTAPPSPATEASPANARFEVGDVVFGQWTDGGWYLGKVGTINADGTYRVDYDDGDVSPSLPADKVKVGIVEIDATTRTRVLDAAVAKLTELYVFPDVAKAMAQTLREHQKAGTYDAITDGIALARLLEEQLRSVSHDRHLVVHCVPDALPDHPPVPSEADKAKFREHFERINCGFRTSERLDGNIGYIAFDMFGDAEMCGPKATAAFAALGEVDALIIDLRQNGGGAPDMVAFVSSYLFAKRTHLNDIYSRSEDKTEQFWTNPEVPGPKFVRQPVYVLTSEHTFSGAEEFAYNLKTLKRATIVGETTGGGAHPTMGVRLDPHFMMGIPFARAINPVTKTNWEGTGVEPDVKVAADQALETAKKLAGDRIAQDKAKPRARKK
jgi:hypothetical protein